MTINEVAEKLADFTDDERERYVRPLTRLLSPVSLQDLRQFQTAWDMNRSSDEFFREQNAVIRRCVAMETSDIGRDVRAALGLDPLSLDTALAVEEENGAA